MYKKNNSVTESRLSYDDSRKSHQGIAVARKYQLQKQERIKPNEADKTSSGCEGEECYVTSQQTSDTF